MRDASGGEFCFARVQKFHKIKESKERETFLSPSFKFIFRVLFKKGLRIVIFFPFVGREKCLLLFREHHSFVHHQHKKKAR